mmetsp:Transcript_21183/g.60476  ORF Transcript_21183/g.60476 Transcript_21183/m.60476 type:complete len:379 (-) Transcript_21183:1387-2523(-)
MLARQDDLDLLRFVQQRAQDHGELLPLVGLLHLLRAIEHDQGLVVLQALADDVEHGLRVGIFVDRLGLANILELVQQLPHQQAAGDVAPALSRLHEVDPVNLGHGAGALVDVVAQCAGQGGPTDAHLSQDAHKALPQLQNRGQHVEHVDLASQEELGRRRRRVLLHHVAHAEFRALRTKAHHAAHSHEAAAAFRLGRKQVVVARLLGPFAYWLGFEDRDVVISTLGQEHELLHLRVRVAQVGRGPHGLAPLLEGLLDRVTDGKRQVELSGERQRGGVLQFGLLPTAHDVRNPGRGESLTCQPRVTGRHEHELEGGNSVPDDQFLDVVDVEPVGSSHSIFKRQELGVTVTGVMKTAASPREGRQQSGVMRRVERNLDIP